MISNEIRVGDCDCELLSRRIAFRLPITKASNCLWIVYYTGLVTSTTLGIYFCLMGHKHAGKIYTIEHLTYKYWVFELEQNVQFQCNTLSIQLTGRLITEILIEVQSLFLCKTQALQDLLRFLFFLLLVFHVHFFLNVNEKLTNKQHLHTFDGSGLTL